ncbi:MAG: hypothetical protein ACK5JM_13320, partial [Rhodoblastus sp.]
ARRFVRLKEKRSQIARRSRIAPASIADDEALHALARLDDADAATCAANARKIVDSRAPVIAELLTAL